MEIGHSSASSVMVYDGVFIDRWWEYSNEFNGVWRVSITRAYEAIEFVAGGQVSNFDCRAVMDDFGALVRVL